MFLQRVKKDVEKGTIHSDMLLLKREGKESQGTKSVLFLASEYVTKHSWRPAVCNFWRSSSTVSPSSREVVLVEGEPFW